VPVPTAGVMQGVTARTVLLIDSDTPAEEWRKRLNTECKILTLPAPKSEDRAELVYVGTDCAAAAARLTGVISKDTLADAVADELSPFQQSIIDENLERAGAAFDEMAHNAGVVSEGSAVSAATYAPPEWVDIPVDDASLSGPAIHAGATSVEVRTGLWRTMRPVIDYDRCNKCAWVCGSFCPDGAISVGDDGFPVIDLDHCKGCLICVAQCPPHAIRAVPEHQAAAEAQQDKRTGDAA
jgi:pyruvate ferredoxin oxidoreductase gamma subunit